MSHTWATVGFSPVQLMVEYGARRALAHELLSPAGGVAFSAKNAMFVNVAVPWWRGVGGAMPVPLALLERETR